MQPVTVAISPTGIEYLLRTLLGDQIAKALETHMTVPDYSLPVDAFIVSAGNTDTTYEDISIQLSGGALVNFAPTFKTYVQGPSDNSEFTITMTAASFQVAYTWTETYSSFYQSFSRGGSYTSPTTQTGPNKYEYKISLAGLTITAIFKLSTGSGAYKLTYVSSSADPGSPQPNIPSQSVLNLQESYDCGFASRISDATVKQLDTIDYGSRVAAALSPIFASIADSGRLGPVEFDFLTPGDSGLVFPAGGGIQIGATGGVSVSGAAYPGKAPADLPLPPVPTGNPAPHATYFVQDYEVDALFWGFFEAGALKITLTAGDLKDDPQALETNTYAGGNLNNLFLAYPGLPMTADLSAQAAPTAAFRTIYQLNAANLPQIQAALGSAVWAEVGAALTGLSGFTFSGQTGFETELGLINPKLPTYASTIEQYAGMRGVAVTHTTRCVLNVLQDGAPTPVITFDVAQTFAMQGLQLGLSGTGTTQSVVFTFVQPMDTPPKASFVSSTVPGVDGGDFGDVWQALRPNWQGAFAAIGKAGLPLPRIPGFEFVFQQAQVGVVPGTSTAGGYLSITANVAYSPERLAPAVQRAIAGRVAAGRA